MIRQKYKIRDEEQVLLFSGKLIKRKGLKLLLDAAKMLPAELRKNIVVMFMGSGELQNHLEKIAREEPVVKAHFLGFKNQNELSQYYNAADLLVLPSLHSETWGLVVNEALHHGLPCVVSEAVGCAPDLIESGVTGEVFKTGSATDLALAIQRSYKLIGQPEVRKWCREKVGGYTVDKAAEGIAKAYFDCVKS
jgi:glycosyltransferase involved in cell wall biosynthesis